MVLESGPSIEPQKCSNCGKTPCGNPVQCFIEQGAYSFVLKGRTDPDLEITDEELLEELEKIKKSSKR